MNSYLRVRYFGIEYCLQVAAAAATESMKLVAVSSDLESG